MMTQYYLFLILNWIHHNSSWSIPQIPNITASQLSMNVINEYIDDSKREWVNTSS